MTYNQEEPTILRTTRKILSNCYRVGAVPKLYTIKFKVWQLGFEDPGSVGDLGFWDCGLGYKTGNSNVKEVPVHLFLGVLGNRNL